MAARGLLEAGGEARRAGTGGLLLHAQLEADLGPVHLSMGQGADGVPRGWPCGNGAGAADFGHGSHGLFKDGGDVGG